MSKTTESQQFTARELIALEDAVFEEVDGRMMATVRILASGTSKNRRNYPPALVQEAVDKGLFNGLQMFIDHNRKNPDPQSRGVRELVSAVESTSWDDTHKAMNGRVEFFDRGFYDYAQRAQKYMGVSINALVRGTRRVVAGETFEDITAWVKPRSVDWVTTPAAGGAILAFEDEEEEMLDWSKVTLEDLKKNRPEVVAAIEAEAPHDDPAPTMSPDEIRQEIQKGIQEGLATAQAAEQEKSKKRAEAGNKIRDAFQKSGLPEKTRARLMAAYEGVEEFDETAVSEAIKEAQEELVAAGAGPRIVGMGPSGSGKDEGAKPAFSVHESVKSSFGITTKSDDPKEGTK